MCTKKCAKCGIEKNVEDFNKSSSSKDKLQSWCSLCVKERSRIHYLANQEKIKAKNIQYKQEIRKWWFDYKSTLKCERCDENHPATLDFHHLDPSKKEYEVSQMITARFLSKEAILNEMKKCIVLCSNCHRKLHFEEKIFNC